MRALGDRALGDLWRLINFPEILAILLFRNKAGRLGPLFVFYSFHQEFDESLESGSPFLLKSGERHLAAPVSDFLKFLFKKPNRSLLCPFERSKKSSIRGGQHLTNEEIAGILKRRDGILAYFDQLLEAQGSSKVFIPES